jgi:hypothetical protein
MSVFALLVGNAVFLLVGVSRLLLVIDGWASQFGFRSAAVFSVFVGLFGIGLPFLAVLLATHVTPMVPRTRLVLAVAAGEYAVSGFFGLLTFLGAFAYDLNSPRAVIEGVLMRGVWLGFLGLASLLLFRVWRGLFPPPPPRPVYGGYPPPTTYGRPYPGQPMYPQTAPTATSPPAAQGSPAGWPEVPPPPMPAPIVMDPSPTASLAIPPSGGDETARIDVLPAEPTTHIELQPPETGGDATQVVPLPPTRDEPATSEIPAAGERNAAQ